MLPLALLCTLAATTASPAYDADLRLLAWGPSPARGRLVNVTLGARPNDPIDPARPTLVVVHGANPFHPALHYAIAERYAEALGAVYGTGVNVVGWDWNADTLRHLWLPRRNLDHVVWQGQQLAASLRATGLDPRRLHLIGQSSGSLAAASAARSMANAGQPPARLTLLDPARLYHDLLFGTLGAGTAAAVVDHYWVESPSAFGAEAPYAGVHNIRLAGSSGVLGLIRPFRSDHLAAVRWHIGRFGR
jgi:hypothetical protein